MHYLKNWKRLRREEQRRAAKRLNRYIESVVRRHPDRYLEVIKKEIRSPRFGKHIEDRFGFDEDTTDIFSESTYDEDVRELIEKLKSKLD